MTDVIIILDDVHNDAILIKQIANWYFTNKLVYLLRVIHPLPPIYRISRTCLINHSIGRLAQSFVRTVSPLKPQHSEHYTIYHP